MQIDEQKTGRTKQKSINSKIGKLIILYDDARGEKIADRQSKKHNKRSIKQSNWSGKNSQRTRA